MTTRLAMPQYILDETAGRTVQEVEQMANVAKHEHMRLANKTPVTGKVNRELFALADRALYLAIQADRMRAEGAR